MKIKNFFETNINTKMKENYIQEVEKKCNEIYQLIVFIIA